jgi:hypothetical protein
MHFIELLAHIENNKTMITSTNNSKSLRYCKVLLLGFVLLTIGCSKDTAIITDPDLTSSSLINGEWEWIKTVDSWTQNVTTPSTEGYNLIIKFKKNATVENYKNKK